MQPCCCMFAGWENSGGIPSAEQFQMLNTGTKHCVIQLNVSLAACSDCVNSHIPETVEPAVLLLIVPLNNADLVEGVDGGQSVDDMRAQEGIDIVRGEFGTAGPVLGPVGHVAHQFTG